MLTADDTIDMIGLMIERANEDEDVAEAAGDEKERAFWEGWASGLETLRQHIRTDVKTSCFPVGSCDCHPFSFGKFPQRTTRGHIWQRAWLTLMRERGR